MSFQEAEQAVGILRNEGNGRITLQEAKRSKPYESSELKVTEGSPSENQENRNGMGDRDAEQLHK